MAAIVKIFFVLVFSAFDVAITAALAIYHATSGRAREVPDDLHGFLHGLSDRVMGACLRRCLGVLALQTSALVA